HPSASGRNNRMIYNINIWSLIILYATYSFISILLFYLTSNGWTVLIYLVYWSLVYGFGLLLLLINGIYRSFKSKRTSANIRINLIQAMLVNSTFSIASQSRRLRRKLS
ncbi:MAG: hypothetical protein AAF349_25640, partial [Cyanobacteria bacterium P01_A01_bin.68]